MGEKVGVARCPAAVGFSSAVALPNHVRVVVGTVDEVLGPFQAEHVVQAVVEALVVGPDAQHTVGLLLPELARNRLLATHGIERDHAPVRYSMCSSSGMAVISLDPSATAVWASTSRLACAQALTRCRGPRPRSRSWEPRTLLPSIGTT